MRGQWKRGCGSKGLKVGARAGKKAQGGIRRSLEDRSAKTVGAMDTPCGEGDKRVPIEGFDKVEEEEEDCNGY